MTFRHWFPVCIAIAVATGPDLAPQAGAELHDRTVTVLDFELNDLTLTPGIKEELERTASVAPLLRSHLETQYGVNIIEIAAASQQSADKAFGYLFDHPQIAAELGRRAGSNWIVVGRVHKASFLFVYLKARVIDTRNERLVADLTVEIKGPQKRLTIKGIESLAKKISAAIDVSENANQAADFKE